MRSHIPGPITNHTLTSIHGRARPCRPRTTLRKLKKAPSRGQVQHKHAKTDQNGRFSAHHRHGSVGYDPRAASAATSQGCQAQTAPEITASNLRPQRAWRARRKGRDVLDDTEALDHQKVRAEGLLHESTAGRLDQVHPIPARWLRVSLADSLNPQRPC